MSKNIPYLVNEKKQDILLPSLNFTVPLPLDAMQDGMKDYTLPSLMIQMMSQKEYLMKLACPILLCNSTGMELYYADASNLENVLPLSSDQNIADYYMMVAKIGELEFLEEEKHLLKLLINHRQVVGLLEV